MKTTLVLLALSLLSSGATASAADLSFPPVSSGGHDFNHAPIGQSFTAVAATVRAGIYLADAGSFENWLATVYPGQIIPGSYPYEISPSVTVRIDLLTGEGAVGDVLCSETRTLTAPFSGFVDIDAGAAGVTLSAGQKYTIIMTDVSGQAYPQGVTGWVVPAFSGYSGGHPVLQGALVLDDSGTGDNCFEVLDSVVADPLAVSASDLTSGSEGVAYYCPITITVSGGTGPFTVGISGLPSGLSFDGNAVSGTPVLAGNYSPLISVTDADGSAAVASVSLTINAPPSQPPGNFTISDESKGKITAIGNGYLMVGRKRLIWTAATFIKVNTPDGELHSITEFVKAGMKVQWKGLLDKATNTVLTSSLEVN